MGSREGDRRRLHPHSSESYGTGSASDEQIRLVADEYPAFIPGFRGSVLEYDFFEPDLQSFAQVAKWGDAENRVFFEDFLKLKGSGVLPPWFEQTWDHAAKRVLTGQVAIDSQADADCSGG